ncbi:MAG: FGGY family carbohydrate kinase [Solirubrobacteraceae bacterium]
MADLLLGIDVGTTACKAALVDAAGAEVAVGSAPTPWRRVRTGAEIDPDRLFAAAVAAGAAALRAAPDGRVAAVGVTSMAETGVLLDAAGEVLHPAIAWHDGRGAAQANAIATDLPAFTTRTGLPASPLCSLAKIAALREAAPETRAAARWLNVAEWVVHRLGGRQVTELSLASRTGLLDVGEARPYQDALAWGGLPDDLLAEPLVAGQDAGRATGDIPSELRGAVLTVAGHDHLAAGVGVGVVAPGDVLDSCGTAEALVRIVTGPLPDEAVRRSVAGGVTVGCHFAPGRQALLGSLWSGLALREVLDGLGLGEADLERLDAAALSIAPGAGAPLVLELHALDRTPPAMPDAAPGAIWRAALDAVAAEATAILAHIDAVSGPHLRVVVAGGWARDSALIATKRARGAVAAPPVEQAGCRGAALLAGVAAGTYAGLDDLPAVVALDLRLDKEPA